LREIWRYSNKPHSAQLQHPESPRPRGTWREVWRYPNKPHSAHLQHPESPRSPGTWREIWRYSNKPHSAQNQNQSQNQNQNLPSYRSHQARCVASDVLAEAGAVTANALVSGIPEQSQNQSEDWALDPKGRGSEPALRFPRQGQSRVHGVPRPRQEAHREQLGALGLPQEELGRRRGAPLRLRDSRHLRVAAAGSLQSPPVQFNSRLFDRPHQRMWPKPQLFGIPAAELLSLIETCRALNRSRGGVAKNTATAVGIKGLPLEAVFVVRSPRKGSLLSVPVFPKRFPFGTASVSRVECGPNVSALLPRSARMDTHLGRCVCAVVEKSLSRLSWMVAKFGFPFTF